MGLEDEIQELEEEIAETPYNKATEQHIGRLKAKLADLRDQLADQESGSGGGGGYGVPRHGDATVAFVGFPSVGKSTLLNAMTNAESAVGSYEFTTLEVVPGMLDHEKTSIQLLDVPGLIQGAAGGAGGGREVIAVLRNADLLVFLVDVFEPEQYALLRDELEAKGVRLDSRPPKVRIDRRDRGAIDVRKDGDVSLDDETIIETCRQHGIINARIVIREDVSIDELNDAILDNRVYLDSLVAVNKIDLADEATLDRTRDALRDEGVESAVGISAEEELGLDVLKERIWGGLDLTRVYMRPQGGDPDYEEPMVFRETPTVRDVAERIHDEVEQRFRFGKVWGPSAEHEGQQVGLDHELEDEDVLSVIFRR